MSYDENLNKDHRKKNGVYYTPKPIVKYILQNTLDKYLQEHIGIEVSDVKVIDISCGTGNFLIEAYHHLTSYWENYHQRRLTSEEKTKIVNDNIYGADIDPIAVNICRQRLSSNNIDLSNNIICTDSLKHDFINKYDVIIGNPPYINIEKLDQETKKYYSENYKYFKARSDVYSLFIEKSLDLLKEEGYVGYVVPSSITNNTSYKTLRKHITSNELLYDIHFNLKTIFKDATVDTITLTLHKSKNTYINGYDVGSKYFKDKDIWYIITEKDKKLLDKIYSNTESIKDYFIVFQGIVSGCNEAFIFTDTDKILSNNINLRLVKPFLFGRDIAQYKIKNNTNKIIYITKNSLVDDNTLRWFEKFPQLHNRRETIKGTIPFYSLQWSREKQFHPSLHRPQDEKRLMSDKIILQSTRNLKLKKRIIATIDTYGYYTDRGIWNIIPKTTEYPNLYYICGLLNSNLFNYVFRKKYLNIGIKKENLEHMPLPSENKETINECEHIVKNIMIYKKEDKDTMELEKRLNSIVYELYDLSEEDIKHIENCI